MRRTRVLENRALGGGVFRLRLEAPAGLEGARPGRFLMSRWGLGCDPLLARPFSLHGAGGAWVEVLYRVVGRGTRLLAECEVGEELTWWGPLGRGFDLGVKRPLLAAGGMGIAPLVYAAAVLAEAGQDPRVVWGVPGLRDWAGVIEAVRGHLSALGVELILASEDGSVGARGLVTEPLGGLFSAAEAVLACGPLAMLRAVAGMCRDSGVACQVSLEAPMACGLGVCQGCVLPRAGGGYFRVCREGPVVDATVVDWDRL